MAVRFANPAKYNVTSNTIFYDPTHTTTSAYLSATDPANGGNVAGGSAATLRVSVWAFAAAAMLSALLVL
jgi:hypothetical protein